VLERLRGVFGAGASSAERSHAAKKRGDASLADDRLDDASRSYREAIEIDAQNTDALVALGFVLTRTGPPSEARRFLDLAVAQEPANADAHYLLGALDAAEGDAGSARTHYARALAADGRHQAACHSLCGLHMQAGEVDEAESVVRRTLAADASVAELHVLLGRVLDARSRHDDAVAAYESALRIAPDDAAVHLALGGALQRARATAKAVAAFRRASELDPRLPGAFLGLGQAQEELGAQDEACRSYEQAACVEADPVPAMCRLANLLLKRDNSVGAIAWYRRVLEISPGHPVEHILKALSGGNPARAPDAYVTQLFDQYAEKFDTDLVQALKYTVPQQIAAALGELLCDRRDGVAIDLGCGTGLAGVAIAPLVRELVGVDLSPRMLDKARERNLYARLVESDLVPMLRGEAGERYDIALAADVLVYFGVLDDLVAQVQRALRPSGLFVFSVESLDALANGAATDDYRLHAKGRYAHARAYLDRLAQEHAFTPIEIRSIVNRIDAGRPVAGYLGLWRKR
jgi:predicted TPR repeat methyltransferase